MTSCVCVFQGSAGRVCGQRLQHQRSGSNFLLGGFVHRGRLPLHRGAQRSDSQQTLYSKGKSCSCVLEGVFLKLFFLHENENSAAPTCFQVEKATMTESPFPEPVWVRPKERGGRWGHGSPFMRGGTLVRSQTFSPGAQSHYVCRVSSDQQLCVNNFLVLNIDLTF